MPTLSRALAAELADARAALVQLGSLVHDQDASPYLLAETLLTLRNVNTTLATLEDRLRGVANAGDGFTPSSTEAAAATIPPSLPRVDSRGILCDS